MGFCTGGPGLEAITWRPWHGALPKGSGGVPMDIHMDKISPIFYRISSLWGCCPKRFKAPKMVPMESYNVLVHLSVKMS